MTKMFKVKIKYTDGTSSMFDVTGRNDVIAREKAIAQDVRDYQSAGIRVPRVDYCEVTLVCTDVL